MKGAVKSNVSNSAKHATTIIIHALQTTLNCQIALSPDMVVASAYVSQIGDVYKTLQLVVPKNTTLYLERCVSLEKHTVA